MHSLAATSKARKGEAGGTQHVPTQHVGIQQKHEVFMMGSGPVPAWHLENFLSLSL